MQFLRSWARGTVVLVGSLTSLTVLMGACSSADSTVRKAKIAEGCSLNSNCDNPLVCTFARCHSECDEDRDCPGEGRCVKSETGNVCQLPLETACTRDSQCEGDQACGVDGECRDNCSDDSDCVGDQVCAKSGECASSLPDKDVVDAQGNIEADPFDDSQGSGGSGGSGGKGNSGGMSSVAGSGGKGSGGKGGGGNSEAGEGGGAGEATGEGGAAGEGGLVCPTGTAECGGNDPTDCETDLSLPSSCGGCAKVCDPIHSTSHCDADQGYTCVVDTCTTGYADCDLKGDNGCESLLAEDEANCGKCGNDCAGGTCKAGVCSASIVMDPGGAATNTTFYEGKLVGNTIVASVYVGTSYQLRTVTLPATEPASEGTILHSFASAGNRRDGTLEVDADYVYWATNSSPYAINRKPLNNPAANIQEMVTAPGPIHHIELTLSAFYYFGSQDSNYGFFTAAKTQGASAQAIPMLGSRYSSIVGMAIAGVGANARFYWAEYASAAAKYQLFSAPVSGSAAPVMVDADVGGGSYIGIIGSGNFAYWSTYFANGKVRRANATDNPNTPQDVVVGHMYPGYSSSGLIADGTYVYFLDNSYDIYRAKNDGSAAPEKILERGSSTVYLQSLFASDGTYLYGGGNGGQVLRIRKTPAP
jgi:uncharacterized membrane protein YgcG